MSKAKRNFKTLSRFDSVDAPPEEIKTRCDVGRIDATWKEDPATGFIHFSAYTARPGIYIYKERQDDGSIKEVRELVRKEVLHHPDVLAGLNNKPVLNEHHYDSSGNGVMVRTDNAKELMAGFTKETHRVAEDGERTRIDGVVSDPILIKQMKSQGKNQTSPGYAAKIKYQGGVHPVYGRYDQEQVWRDYNHFSITWRGRGGSDVRLDADETFMRFDGWQINETTNEQETPEMVEIEINGHKVEVSEAAKIAYEAEKSRVDSEMKTLNDKVEGVEKEKEKLAGRVDSLEAELTEANQFRVDSYLSEIKEQSAKILGEDFKFDGLSALDIKKAVIKAKQPNKDLEGYSEDRVDGAYEVIIESSDQQAPQTRTDSFNKANNIYQNAERVDAHKQSADAYQKMIESKQNKWKAGK